MDVLIFTDRHLPSERKEGAGDNEHGDGKDDVVSHDPSLSDHRAVLLVLSDRVAPKLKINDHSPVSREHLSTYQGLGILATCAALALGLIVVWQLPVWEELPNNVSSQEMRLALSPALALGVIAIVSLGYGAMRSRQRALRLGGILAISSVAWMLMVALVIWLPGLAFSE